MLTKNTGKTNHGSCTHQITYYPTCEMGGEGGCGTYYLTFHAFYAFIGSTSRSYYLISLHKPEGTDRKQEDASTPNM